MSSGQVQTRGGRGDGRRVGLWLGGLAAMALAAGVALAVTETGGEEAPGSDQAESTGETGSGRAGTAGVATLIEPARSGRDGDASGDAVGADDVASAVAAVNQAAAEALAGVPNVTIGENGTVVIGGGAETGTVIMGSGGTTRWIAPGTYQPQGFDPKQFDVTAFLDEAEGRARAHYDDAVLVRIDASGVYPSGKADLTLSDSFYVNYTFISPSRAKRPEDLPIGVDHKPNCKYYVWVTQDGVWPRPVDGWTCDEPVIGRPRCSFADTWRKAIAAGAPSEKAVATIGYYSWSGATRWYATVGDAYSGVHEDGCR